MRSEMGTAGVLGWVVLLGGVAGAVFALQMDTTIAIDNPLIRDRVHNVGLMNDRQAYLIASGIAAVIGLGLIAIDRIGGSSPRAAWVDPVEMPDSERPLACTECGAQLDISQRAVCRDNRLCEDHLSLAR